MKTSRRVTQGYTMLRHQRGAVAVFVAISIIALITVLLLGLDVGRLYYAQRQLESQANLAALAGARVVSGCSGSSAANGVPNQVTVTEVTDAVLQSLSQNSGSGFANLGAPSNLLTTGINGFPSVRLGRTLVSAGGYRTFQSVSEQTAAGVDPVVSDSVQVNLSMVQPTPYLLSFFPGMATGKQLVASATAKQGNVGSFSVGTGLLNVDSSQSPVLNAVLGQMLGTNVNLNAVSYMGLASASVTLGQLSARLGLAVINPDGTLGPLLTSNIPIATLLGAVAQSNGSSVLQTIATGARGSLQLEQILGISNVVSSTISALPINTAELLFAAAADVGRNQPISLAPSLNLSPLLSTGAFLSIGQAPQIGVGQAGKDANGNYYTEAKSAQVTLNVRASALQIPVLGTSVTLGLDAQVAQATAGLDRLTCPVSNGSPAQATITGFPNAVTLAAGTFSGSATDTPADPLKGGSILKLLGLNLLGIKITVLTVDLTSVANAQSGGPGQQLEFSPPYPSAPQRVADGLDLAGLTSSLTTDFIGKLQPNVLGVLPLPLGTILSDLGGALSPLLGVLNNAALQPVLQLLGIQIGYADIRMLGVTQDQPAIQTNCTPGVIGGNGCPAAP